jgi:hypothetical protein
MILNALQRVKFVMRMHLSLKIFEMEMRFVSLGDYQPSGFLNVHTNLSFYRFSR